MKIIAIDAYQIFDSRGNPTIEAVVTLGDGSVGHRLRPVWRIDRPIRSLGTARRRRRQLSRQVRLQSHRQHPHPHRTGATWAMTQRISEPSIRS